MKKFLLSFTVLLSLSTQAQITINTSDLPVSGTSMVNIREFNLSGIYPGDPGADQVYDISGFQNSGQDTIYFFNPAQTPYGSSFGNSTISRFQTSDSSYVYMIEGSNKLEINGLVMSAPLGDARLTGVAEDPLIQFTFPMDYETAFEDTARFQSNSMYYNQVIVEDPYTYFDSIRINMAYKRTSMVDGWGTLVTPFGSSFSVLRQKIQDITLITPEVYLFYVDTIFTFPITIPIGWQAMPGTEMGDTTITYNYLANTASGNPMILAELQEDAMGNISSAQYAQMELAAIEQLSLSNVFVFPNPATDRIELKSPVLLNNLRMLGPDGKTILSAKVNSKTTNIDLSAFAAGIYTLIIDTEKGQEIKRVNKL